MFSRVDLAIKRHGLRSTYVVVTEGTYDVNTSSATNTETWHVVDLYKKHIHANQFNFPNLIDKDISMFYLSSVGIGFIPKIGDYILYDSKKYKVESIFEHTAFGQVELYKIVGVK